MQQQQQQQQLLQLQLQQQQQQQQQQQERRDRGEGSLCLPLSEMLCFPLHLPSPVKPQNRALWGASLDFF